MPACLVEIKQHKGEESSLRCAAITLMWKYTIFEITKAVSAVNININSNTSKLMKQLYVIPCFHATLYTAACDCNDLLKKELLQERMRRTRRPQAGAEKKS